MSSLWVQWGEELLELHPELLSAGFRQYQAGGPLEKLHSRPSSRGAGNQSTLFIGILRAEDLDEVPRTRMTDRRSRDPPGAPGRSTPGC